MLSKSRKPSVFSILTWGLILTVMIVTVIFNSVSFFVAARQGEADLQARATDSARELAGVLGTALWNFDDQTIERTAQVYTSLADVVRLQVLDTAGNSFYAHDSATADEVAISSRQLIYYNDQTVGEVEISISTQSIQQLQQDNLRSTLFSTVAVVLAIVITNQVLLRRFLRQPMNVLTSGLGIIAQGSYDHRLASFNNAEFDAIAQSVNNMAGQIADREYQLRNLIDTLEARVADRTRNLNVAASVSRQITTTLNRQDLLDELVRLTQQAFNFYQVNIYVVDQDTSTLTLTAAAGVASEAMLENGKQYRLEQKGIVPSAGNQRCVVVSNDVTRSMDHVINSLLPLTRAEAGVPIIYGDTLFGVLDLQSETVDRFTEAEIELFVSLANQIAIAMRNAALFEDAGKSRERAEQSDRVKSAFLASMSHELRTPLNAIINFSKFLKKEIPGRINDEQRDLIGNIADSGQHLLNLINDVLDMSKIESGALKLYVEQDIDLRNILATAINYTQPILADKPVSLYQDLPETLPLMHGDRKRLLQVFLNIISNACKFTESGSVRISAYAEQDHMTIAIADTGPGIAPEDADAVFTAFKQTDSGLRQGGGTGLGMPICKKLVEAHAGQLWFESESGKGSTFFVKLPLVESTQAEPKAPEKVTQYA